jgi:hypothetical protein
MHISFLFIGMAAMDVLIAAQIDTCTLPLLLTQHSYTMNGNVAATTALCLLLLICGELVNYPINPCKTCAFKTD